MSNLLISPDGLLVSANALPLDRVATPSHHEAFERIASEAQRALRLEVETFP